MTADQIRAFLGWCAVINYADAIHYAGMGLYKLGIFLFNLVSYVALVIVA